MTSTNPSSLTELEAVNIILSTIGEAPINDLEGASVPDVALARQFLNQSLREIQSIGWQFNTDYDYPLTPDSNGNIFLPSNFVRVNINQTPTGYFYSQPVDIAVRGNQLYDRKGKTYVFTQQILCEVVQYLPFDKMPDPAKWFITIHAARRFQDSSLGSDTLHKFNQEDELRAKQLLEEYEGDSGHYSIFDSWSMYRIMER